MKDEHLLEAFNVWQDLSMSDEDVIAYQSRLKYLLDEEAKYDHARHEGKKDNLKEIIYNSIKNNIPIETIALITDLSIEEIQKISKGLEDDNER